MEFKVDNEGFHLYVWDGLRTLYRKMGRQFNVWWSSLAFYSLLYCLPFFVLRVAFYSLLLSSSLQLRVGPFTLFCLSSFLQPSVVWPLLSSVCLPFVHTSCGLTPLFGLSSFLHISLWP